MSTRFTSTSIIFNDATEQISANPLSTANNTDNAANGALFIEKSGSELRFKNITTDSNPWGTWTVQTPSRSFGLLHIIYNPGMPSPPEPVGSE